MSDAVRKRRILVVDDHPIVRQGIARLIDDEPGLEVCGHAEDPPSAMREVSRLAPDLVTVDLSLASGDGLDLIKGLRAQFPRLPILVLTMRDPAIYAERALRAGAQGFLSKQEASEKIIEAIEKLLAGELYVSEELSPSLLRRLLSGDHDGDPVVGRLSDRELQVFRLIGQGLGSQEIARELDLSVKTIETYRAHLKDKLGLADGRQLVQFAIRWFRESDAR